MQTKIDIGKMGIGEDNTLDKGTLMVEEIKIIALEQFDSDKVAFCGKMKEMGKESPMFEISNTKRHGIWIKPEATEIPARSELSKLMEHLSVKTPEEIKELPLVRNKDGYLVIDF